MLCCSTKPSTSSRSTRLWKVARPGRRRTGRNHPTPAPQRRARPASASPRRRSAGLRPSTDSSHDTDSAVGTGTRRLPGGLHVTSQLSKLPADPQGFRCPEGDNVSAAPFFAELQRRNVLRAGAFYAAAAWLLVQVATQVFPFLHIPEWVVRWIVVAAVIGFPFALAFAWFYEFTPQGLRRESEIAPAESITRTTGKKLDRWITAILGVPGVMQL